jgi:hypothetical protein
MSEPAPPLPLWVPQMWFKSDAHRRVLTVLDTLTPDEARRLLEHLRALEPWRSPIVPGPQRPQYASAAPSQAQDESGGRFGRVVGAYS